MLSILTITPKFYDSTYLMALWGLFFLLKLLTLNRSNGILGHLFTLGVIYVFICLIYKLLGISSASMGYCILAPFFYFVPVFALMIIDRCENEQQIRFLFHFLALAVAFNIADNIWLSYEYGIDNLVFQNLGGKLEEEGLTELNFGGSQFVNMSVFYACMMFMAFLKSNNRNEKYLFLVYWGISAYFIVFCSLKASAVILLLLSLALMYISYKTKGKNGNMLTLTAIVGALLFFLRDGIFNFLIDIIDSDRITVRLTSLTTEGDVEDSSLMGRSNLWLVSIQSWLSSLISFFFGIGSHNWKDFMTTAESGVGNHSDWLDVLAKYGIIGALILYSSLKEYYEYLNNKYGNSFKYEILSFFLLILIMGLTKKIVNAQPAIMIFILFPLTLKYCSYKVS